MISFIISKMNHFLASRISRDATNRNYLQKASVIIPGVIPIHPSKPETEESWTERKDNNDD